MFWQRLRTFFEPVAGDPESSSPAAQAEGTTATTTAEAVDGYGYEDGDVLALQAGVEGRLAEAHASMWAFDLEAAEAVLQALRPSPHPLVHLHRAQLQAMKLLLGGADALLADAIATCDLAAKHARSMALKARERQGSLGEMPVHLSACFVVECTVTEAEALLLAAGLEMYRKGYVPTARLLQLSWKKYKMLRNILTQLRKQSKEVEVSVDEMDDDSYHQNEAVQKLKALIDEKTAFIRALNVDRHGVVPEMVLAHTNELLRLKQLFKELTGGWVSSDGHAISNSRKPNHEPAQRPALVQKSASVGQEPKPVAASLTAVTEEAGGAENEGELEEEQKTDRAIPKRQGMFKQSSFREVITVHAKRFTLGGKGHRRTNSSARKMRPQIKRHNRNKSKSSGHTRSHTFSDLQAQLDDPNFLQEAEGLAQTSLSIEDGEVLIRAVFGDDAADGLPSAVSPADMDAAHVTPESGSQRAQQYQAELSKVVAELARRIDFGLAIFHLISSFASKSLSWAISLVGAPNDPEAALRLLVKVHRHGGMRGQLASLALLALPTHLQQLLPATIDSRASPTAIVALVEAHVHMRIPKSPFLYWLLARTAGTSSHLTTSRLELAKRALELAAPVRDDTAILREFLAFLCLTQAKWPEAAEHALHVSVSAPGRRQCRFLASMYRVAALAAQEVLGIASNAFDQPPSPTSPKSPASRLQAKLNRPRRPSGTKSSLKSLTMGPMRGTAGAAKLTEGDMFAAAGRRPSLVSRDDASSDASSNAWSLLQHAVGNIQPLESEAFAKRRAATYLKRGASSNLGLWLLAPEAVYCFYWDQPFADQVNHLEMLRLLDLGAMALAAELASASQFSIVSELITALVTDPQQVLIQSEVLGKYSEHLDVEVFHEVSPLGKPSIRFRLQTDAASSPDDDDRNTEGVPSDTAELGGIGDVVVSWFLLRGCALRHLSRVNEASLMFRLVPSFRAFVGGSTFVVPVALFHHANMMFDSSKHVSSGKQLESVRFMMDRAERSSNLLRSWDYDLQFQQAISAFQRKLAGLRHN